MTERGSLNEKTILKLFKKKPVSFKTLTTAIALIITIISLIVMFVGAKMVREKAVRDLAKEEARDLSQLVFQSLFSAMAKGWTKAEIVEIIKRLNKVQPDMRIKVFRGFPVIKQFGEIPGEEELRRKDPLVMKALKGEESLLTNEHNIRYYYPVRVQDVCKRCHNIEVGDIAGVIDVEYPIKRLKVSLNFLINPGLISFTLFLILIFTIFYFSVRSFIVRPVIELVGVIAQI